MKKLLLLASVLSAMVAGSAFAGDFHKQTQAPKQSTAYVGGGFVAATVGTGASYGGTSGYSAATHFGSSTSNASTSGIGEAESGYNASINSNGTTSFTGSSMVHTGSSAVANTATNGGVATASGFQSSVAGTSLSGYGVGAAITSSGNR
jgi:hypothetical protein